MITVGRSDDPSRVGVIVTGVDPASEKDMASLRATYPEQVTARAYLIRVTLVNEDGKDDFGGYSGPLLNGDLDGGDAGNFKLLGANVVLSTCTDYSSPPAGWTARGARFETCRIIFADPVGSASASAPRQTSTGNDPAQPNARPKVAFGASSPDPPMVLVAGRLRLAVVGRDL